MGERGDNLEQGVETRGRTLTRVCAACAVCRHLVPQGDEDDALGGSMSSSGRASTLGLAAVRCAPGRVGVSRENVPRTSARSARQSPRRFKKRACHSHSTCDGHHERAEDVNDFGDVEDAPSAGLDEPEDPFGGSDLEHVTDEEEEDGEDLMENQEICVPVRSPPPRRVPAVLERPRRPDAVP